MRRSRVSRTAARTDRAAARGRHVCGPIRANGRRGLVRGERRRRPLDRGGRRVRARRRARARRPSTPPTTRAPPSDASGRGARGLSEDELFAKLEDDYWRVVEHATGEESEAVVVDYGNDLDTPSYWSGFPTREAAAPPPPPSDAAGAPPPPPTAAANPELPSPSSCAGASGARPSTCGRAGGTSTTCPRGRARCCHFRVPVPGINVPWLYVGMLFSTFCWHNEDNYLASINVNHVGAPKQWYGVPGASSSKFEDVVRKFLSQTIKKIPDLLHHMNTQFSPSLLRAADVPVYQLRQNPGEFVVTFPQAFHAGFSYGFNVGEAVNFANTQWIKHAHVANSATGAWGGSRCSRTTGSCSRCSTTSATSTATRRAGSSRKLIRLVHEELVLRPLAVHARRARRVDAHQPAAEPHRYHRQRVVRLRRQAAVCCVCQHISLLPLGGRRVQLLAETQVACLRHHQYMCRCQPSNKYLLAWMHDDQRGPAAPTLPGARTTTRTASARPPSPRISRRGTPWPDESARARGVPLPFARAETRARTTAPPRLFRVPLARSRREVGLHPPFLTAVCCCGSTLGRRARSASSSARRRSRATCASAYRRGVRLAPRFAASEATRGAPTPRTWRTTREREI